MSPGSGGSRLSLEVPLSPPQSRQTQPMTLPTSPPSLNGLGASDQAAESMPRSNGSLHQPPPAEPIADDQDTVRTRSDTGSSLRSYTPLGISHADADSSSPATTVSDGHSNRDSVPAKRDSLTRSGAARGQFQRKGTTGSLQRQSVISRRDSNSLEGLVHSPVDLPNGDSAPVTKGVQLEDKPMDFD
jgi:hypothetical protein